MIDNKIIVKVRQSNTGQKIVTIPRDCDIEKDEYVEVFRLNQL